MNKVIGSCSSCGYPIAAGYTGEIVSCPMCGIVNKATISDGTVAIPTSLLVGVLSFLGGMVLGPAVLASTKAGSDYLERQVRQHIIG